MRTGVGDVTDREAHMTGKAMEFRMRPVNCGLLSALALWCGFQPQPANKDSARSAHRGAAFGIAIWSNIPADLPAVPSSVEACSFIIACSTTARAFVPCLHGLASAVLHLKPGATMR
jgi:hypothetical protein